MRDAETAAALVAAVVPEPASDNPIVIGWDDAVVGRGLPPLGAAAAAIGTFDGVHRGHTELLGRLRRHGVAARVAVTFRVPPRTVLRDTPVHSLMTEEQRYRALAAEGVTHVVVIDFSAEFSKMPGKDFLAVFAGALPIVRLVVGSSFRCGRGRDTDVAEMRRVLAPIGVEVDPVPPVQINGQPISSSRIRQALCAGDIPSATEMLGHPYVVEIAAGTEGESRKGHRFSVGRERVAQLLPAGRYSGAVLSTAGAPKVTLEVTDRAVVVVAAQRGDADGRGVQFLASGMTHAIEVMARETQPTATLPSRRTSPR